MSHKTVKINSETMNSSLNRAYNVSYYLYAEDGDGIVIYDVNELKKNRPVQANINTICFANLRSDANSFNKKNKKKANRLMYVISQNPKTGRYLSGLVDEESIAWLNLAKDNKALPEYITEEAIIKATPVIKLVDTMPSLLYVYLCSIRLLNENAGFVRIMLRLTSKYEMNFCAAWVVASKIIISNYGHNIINIARHYGYKEKDDISNIEVPTATISCLYHYLENPAKYDNRSLEKFLYGSAVSTRYNACDIINSIPHGKQNRSVTALDLIRSSQIKKILKE